MNDYRVDLEVYNGPLDLLLYLIRREEVDIYDIPVARVTEQYVAYVNLLERLDPDAAGDFLVLAATLMEIKSRMLLPTPPPAEDGEPIEDPRAELVRQLLEYKSFKDAARELGEAAEIRALRHHRIPIDLPQERGLELDEVGIWDLLTAFQKLLEQIGRAPSAHEVIDDDTPIALYAEDLLDALERAGGSLLFEHVFTARGRAQLVGLFLALLELIRRKRVRATQESPFGPITLHVLDAAPLDPRDFEQFDAGFVADVERPPASDASASPEPPDSSGASPEHVDSNPDIDRPADDIADESEDDANRPSAIDVASSPMDPNDEAFEATR